MIEIAGRHNGSFFLQASLIESIIEREGNTCEIITTTGTHYVSIWSKEKVAQKINEFIFRQGSDED